MIQLIHELLDRSKVGLKSDHLGSESSTGVSRLYEYMYVLNQALSYLIVCINTGQSGQSGVDHPVPHSSSATLNPPPLL